MLDTESCEISVPPKKWKTFVELLTGYLKAGRITFKELEKLRGKCVSFILCNPYTKLFIRQMNKIIALLTKKGFPPGHVITIEGELKEELEEWIKLDFLQMRHVWSGILQSDDLPHIITWTDASSFSIGVVILAQTDQIISKQWFFDEETQKQPISYKEGLAILWMLQSFECLKGKKILHFCDNTNVVDNFHSMGSKKDRANKIILQIYKELKRISSTLVLKWVSTHYQLADEASRNINWNEEYIPEIEFARLCNHLQIVPTIDLFASRANHKCPKWINFGLENFPGCVGFDFFAFNPKLVKNQVLYAFPPKNIINKVAAHLDQFYKNHKFVLIFHVFAEIPIGIPILLKRAVLKKVEITTIIPAEFELMFEGQKHWGFFNTKPKATYALCHKI